MKKEDKLRNQAAQLAEKRNTATLRFQPYPEYKDSGVEMLGEIPEHWAVTTLKRIGTLQGGSGFPEGEQGNPSEEIPFFKVGDMGANGNEREMKDCPNTVSRSTIRRLGAFVFPPRAIVFAKVGAALLLNRRRLLCRYSCVDNNMMGFMPEHCDSGWALYWLGCLDFRRIANPGAVPSISEGQLSATHLALPPFMEQQRIARFLDRETAKLDALLAKKEQLRRLLHEKRSVLIDNAVTKGLDPAATTKSSGLEWLGEIPVHWSLASLKRAARRGYKTFTDGDWIESPFIEDDGIRLIQTGNIRVGCYNEQGFRYISAKTFRDLKCTEVMAQDVLICRLDGPVGRACLAPDLGVKMITSVDNVILKIDEAENDPRFIVYYLSARPWLEWIQAICRAGGGFRFRISRLMLGEQSLVLPPIREQNGISNFLDTETEKLRLLEIEIQRAIELLKEYRNGLISAVITGKVDVRQEAT